jgi:MATE family multidrug resistance protein
MFIAAGAAQGSVELAVNTLLMQFFTIYSYFMDGFAYAGEALVGRSIGAGDREEYHNLIRRLFLWGGAVALVFVALYLFGGDHFMSVLTDDVQVLQRIDTYLPWTLLLPLCGMASFMWDGIYIGATAVREMLISMAVSMLVFLLGYYTLVPLYANHGLWLSFLAYLSCRGLMQTIMRRKIFS